MKNNIILTILLKKIFKDKATRAKKKMEADEPLITEYHLQNWMAKEFTTDDISQRRFERKDRYHGFMRLI